MAKKEINEGLFGAAKKFSDSFFDGLKSNVTNNALKNAKKRKDIPVPIVKKMEMLDKAARELERMMKDLE